MRVLVTGGNGFVGGEAVRRIACRGDEVVALDAAVGPELARFAENSRLVSTVTSDITDATALRDVFAQHRPDAVLHFAAIVGVPAGLRNSARMLEVNVQGTVNLFEAMQASGVRRVVHLSSEEVYGDFRTPSATEDHPAQPLMTYGITKLAVEHFGRSYRELTGIECINVRTSWVYGIRLDRPRPPMNYLNAALEGRPFEAPAGGETVIDYTYIDDVIDGILMALDHEQHHYDVYNVASGQATSDYELVDLVRELVPGARLSVGPGRREFVPGVRIPVKGALDCTRAGMEFGYRPRYDIRRGIAAYIDAWRARAAAS